MISRRNPRVFCELCSQKTPRGILPMNSNNSVVVASAGLTNTCKPGALVLKWGNRMEEI